MLESNETYLFSKRIVKRTEVRKPLKKKLRQESVNRFWLGTYSEEGITSMPLCPAYNGPLPSNLEAFSDIFKNREHNHLDAVHFYEYDWCFNRLWVCPLKYMKTLRKRTYIIAPDFSLYLDVHKQINQWNIFRCRMIACKLASLGFIVIPSASWGDADSFSYCFDGLPEHSIIAINHSVIGNTPVKKILFELGVRELVRRKHPSCLLVYGFELPFDPGVEVKYYKSRIQKLREL